MNVSRRARPTVVRLAAVTAISALVVAVATTSNADDPVSDAAVPRADCGPGSRPETSVQGRVPAADYESGRAQKGYSCNTRRIGHYGSSGGFKTFRYVDTAGRACAYYDSTLLFPSDVPFNVGSEGLGVIALDMSDPRKPVKTAELTTPAMLSPHETVLLNQRRGLLVAIAANAGTQAGIVEVYDVRSDCRHPELLSSTPTGLLGHESGMAPDGRTLYVSSTFSGTLTAVDLSDPKLPRTLFTTFGVNYHGMRVSQNGNRLYVAEIGYSQDGAFSDGGLTILDVSEIQKRVPLPKAPVVSKLSWRGSSIPQVPIPMRIKGHEYLLEIDEFANFDFSNPEGPYQEDAPVGAARIINIDDDKHPRVVSNIRLQVNQPKSRKGPAQNDPGADSPLQGYTGHYCSVPRRVNPKIVACSFIASGVRLFDVRHPRKPKEVGYFNKPLAPGVRPGKSGAYAMSAPAWDMAGKQLWYTDGNTGFHVLKLTNGIASKW